MLPEIKIAAPICSWESEKHSDSTNSASICNAMLVYPNPASQQVNISYNYGNGNYTERSISVFDQMGRKIEYEALRDMQGVWNLNTADWTPGMYIIRMEGDGKALQIQKLIVSN